MIIQLVCIWMVLSFNDIHNPLAMRVTSDLRLNKTTKDRETMEVN